MDVAVIGAGPWGQRYKETISGLPDFRLFTTVTRSSPMTVDDLADRRTGVEFVVVATPPDVRYEIAKKLLKAKMPLILEKPVALSVKETEKIVDLAEKYDVPCLVSYTDLYNPAYQAFRFWVGDALRRKNVPFQTFLGVFGNVTPGKFAAHWDYGPHVLAVLGDIFGEDILKSVAVSRNNHTSTAIAHCEAATCHVLFGAGMQRKHRFYGLSSVTEDARSVLSDVSFDDVTAGYKVLRTDHNGLVHSPSYGSSRPLENILKTMRELLLKPSSSVFNYHLRQSVTYARILERLD